MYKYTMYVYMYDALYVGTCLYIHVYPIICDMYVYIYTLYICVYLYLLEQAI